ncbi:MAG: hypothetical protein A3G87_05100 [Omnitrophica bacterium RIFCSPLOWO2_12_FULL_50_11]|nr:MAG: hypothetical protein A3G87_05100 [Omnitrophica bacterium RIFCSPLOWO2_12_FULL_50_11]
MPRISPITIYTWPRAVLHIDGDAFFASCEQAIHPELKGKPVITGKERNIVASMSYEAKALGIRRAISIWEAKKICPNVVIVPSDYETYSLISKRMFSVMRRFTPTVEESSIDEGYADLTGLRRLYRTSYSEIAKQIKHQIETELDIPVSAGLSLTKTLAKLASKYRKPRGFTSVPGDVIHHFLKEIPICEVCGIGPNTTALLKKKGVFWALDYVQKNESWVKQYLGKIGGELWNELRGEPIYPLVPEAKTTYDSISKTKTFSPPTHHYEHLKARLYRNVESAFIKLRRYRLSAKRFTVYLREQDFKDYGIQSDLNRATPSPQEAFPLIETMLQELYRPNVLYRQTGIVLSRLQEDRGLQFELFEDPVRMVSLHRLARSIDEINARYGKHTVHSGMELYLKPGTIGENGRNTIPLRKTTLLYGETARQRLSFPMVQIKV